MPDEWPQAMSAADNQIEPQLLDLAARDVMCGLGAMPLSIGRYLRELSAEDCEELGQWLLRRADQLGAPKSSYKRRQA